MDKPIAITETYYNYTECEQYIKVKYDIKRMDKFSDWLFDRKDVNCNGSYFTVYSDDLESDYDITDWHKEIIKLLLDEFGKPYQYMDGSIDEEEPSIEIRFRLEW